MSITPAMGLEEFLPVFNQKTSALGLFAYEGGSTLGVKDYLAQKKQEFGSRPKEIWVFVGSEGGFSPAEVEKMRHLALYPVTLGSQVLRVETACMALVSVLKYDFDLMC